MNNTKRKAENERIDGTRNQNLESRNKNPETRNQNPEARIKKPSKKPRQ